MLIAATRRSAGMTGGYKGSQREGLLQGEFFANQMRLFFLHVARSKLTMRWWENYS